MDETDFFNDHDLKEVSKKTLISIKDLERLKNEKFDGLSKTKGLGLLKIIEREYKIDLSYKRKSFLDFIEEFEKDKKQEYFIVPPQNNSSKIIKIISFSFLLLILFGILYVAYLKINMFQTNSDVYQQNQVVSEAKKLVSADLNESNTSNDLNSFKEIVDNNSSKKETDINKSLKTADATDKSNFVKDKDSKKEKSMPLKNVTKKNENNITASKIILKPSVEKSDYTLIIRPKSKIWVGVINLKNYKRKSYLQNSDINLSSSSGPLLIATGHGNFKLIDGNKILDFSKKVPLRFYVKDGNITEISRQEFIKLNRGKYW